MVKIITDELVKRIYKITGEEVRGDFIQQDKEIWYGLRQSTKTKYFYKELLETFETKELAKEAGEALGDLFSGQFRGDDE